MCIKIFYVYNLHSILISKLGTTQLKMDILVTFSSVIKNREISKLTS